MIEAPAGTSPEVPLASEKVSVSPASGSLAVAVKASSLPAVAFLLPTGLSVGARVGRGHGDGDRLAVGGGAVGDAHVEGVRADLGAARRPAEGAAPVIEAPAGTSPEVPLASEKVSVSPASGSLAVAVKASSLPAVAFLLPTGSSVGAVLAAATVTVIVSQSEAAPSETHTSKVCAPTWAPLGVQLKAPARGDRGARGHQPGGAVGEREGERVAGVGIARGGGEGELAAGGGVLVADRVERGRRVGRGHGDGDRLAVGGGAVGDAHVEGVRADLGAARRPAEGAARR